MLGTQAIPSELSLRNAGNLAGLFFGLSVPWFLFMSGIASWAPTVPDRSFWAVGGLYLLAACFSTAVLLSRWGGFRNPNAAMPSVLTASIITIVISIAGGLLFYLWDFELDDKWLYYRVSENVFSTGLPLWNSQERALVGASFLYPYLLSPGNLFGGWLHWDIYQKTIGIIFHFAAGFVVLRHFQYKAVGVLCAAAILLFEPALQWALGGLETAFATLWMVIGVTFYLRNGPHSHAFWLMAGILIFIRPDAILLGVGTFIAQFVRHPTRISQHLIAGGLFSAPILAFLGINQFLFGFPLPLVFLVKGWNCAYCGQYPIWYTTYTGMTHMLSAISISTLMAVLLLMAVIFLIRGIRIQNNVHAPILAELPFSFDLMIGLALYLGYHVVGGYQHMNFTFRYWVPGLIGATVVACEIISRTAAKPSFNTDDSNVYTAVRRIFALPSIGAILLLQVTQSSFAAYQGKVHDIALTVSPLKDQFSVDSYRSFLQSWLQAGLDLSRVVRPEDRVFLLQGMATGALTKGYLVDQFYFPPNRSKYPDLRTCVPQVYNLFNCAILYDYYVTHPGREHWPPSHEPWKEYQTIAVLKRKSFPAPKTPTEVHATRISSDTVDITWSPPLGNFHSEIEVQLADNKRVFEVPPDYRVYRVDDLTSQSARVRIRACNDKGCSSWSEPIVLN
jgi:hypothetical protein